jgi:hypothetical protein
MALGRSPASRTIVVVFASASAMAASRPAASYPKVSRTVPVSASRVSRCRPVSSNTYTSPPSEEAIRTLPMPVNPNNRGFEPIARTRCRPPSTTYRVSSGPGASATGSKNVAAAARPSSPHGISSPGIPVHDRLIRDGPNDALRIDAANARPVRIVGGADGLAIRPDGHGPGRQKRPSPDRRRRRSSLAHGVEHGRDRAVGNDAPDARSRVHVQRPVARHGQGPGKHERRGGGRSTISGRADDSGSGDGRDPAVRAHATDAIVAGIRDVERPVATRNQARRVLERRQGRRAAITRESGLSSAGHPGDDAVGPYSPHAILGGLGDVEAAVHPDRDGDERRPEVRLERRPVVAGKTTAEVAGDAPDDAVGADGADPAVLAVEDVDRAIRCDGHSPRIVERREGGVGAVAGAAGSRGGHPGDPYDLIDQTARTPLVAVAPGTASPSRDEYVVRV